MIDEKICQFIEKNPTFVGILAVSILSISLFATLYFSVGQENKMLMTNHELIEMKKQIISQPKPKIQRLTQPG